MRSWFPFADYDFWGYLTAGAVLAFAISSAVGTPLTTATLSDPLNAIAFAAASYTLGHANAALSSWLIESTLVRQSIGSPLRVMLGDRKAPLLISIFAPSYRSLPSYTIEALKLRFSSGTLPIAEELFQRAYNFSRGFPDVRDRLDGFRNQYGFCRNAALATLIAGWFALPYAQDRELIWIAVVVATALLLFARYLKFYRLFAFELISTFAFRKEA